MKIYSKGTAKDITNSTLIPKHAIRKSHNISYDGCEWFLNGTNLGNINFVYYPIFDAYKGYITSNDKHDYDCIIIPWYEMNHEVLKYENDFMHKMPGCKPTSFYERIQGCINNIFDAVRADEAYNGEKTPKERLDYAVQEFCRYTDITPETALV